MLKTISIISLILIMVLISTQCKNKAAVAGVDVAVIFSEEKLSDNLITDINYIWKTDSEFVKMGQDFNVFVHFWHNGNLLFSDNHIPAIETSKWEPEKEYAYTRRIYIPIFIDEFDPDFRGVETLKLSLGFFSPYDRSGESKKKIIDKKLKVFLPPLDTPEIIYEEGWFDLEINPESFLKQWRWMGKTARCIIDNPHRDALLVIKGGLHLEAVKDQKVIFKINDLTLDEFIPSERSFEKSYNIKKEMLGDGDEFLLTISTDKTFVPAENIPNSTDIRELGLQISFIYFR